MQSTTQLFVYGSLRSGFNSPAYEYVSRYFTLVGPAKVTGTLYDMGQYPAAISTDATERFIHGELYTIKNIEALNFAIAQLDDYEGVNGAEPGEAPLFIRKLTPVIANGVTTDAWAYWFNGDVTGKPVIECGDMMQYVQQKRSSL